RQLLTIKIKIDRNKILFFDQNSEDIIRNLKFIEEVYFERLKSEWMEYILLVKSEGGKTKIVDVIISKLVHLCQQGYNPILLIDLDGGTINPFGKKLKEKLTNRFRGCNLNLNSCKLLDKIDEASMWSIELFKNAKNIGTIYVIGFHSKLEDVIGIKDTDSDEEKKVIANTYIKNSRIHEMFQKALQI
ncbi:MAG: hypothetical protein ABIE23_04320, partial [archaeon]